MINEWLGLMAFMLNIAGICGGGLLIMVGRRGENPGQVYIGLVAVLLGVIGLTLVLAAHP